MKITETISRRAFLRRIGTVGILGPGVTLLAACNTRESEPGAPKTSAAGESSAAEDPCSDVSGLSASEVQTREATGYLKETPDPTSRCDNCKFWLPPGQGEPCGECVVIPGPVHPGGYCNSWAPMKET